MPTVKQLRTKWGMSQQELATKAGLGITTVGRMEAGKPVQKSSVTLVAHVLGVKPETITGVVVKKMVQPRTKG